MSFSATLKKLNCSRKGGSISKMVPTGIYSGAALVRTHLLNPRCLDLEKFKGTLSRSKADIRHVSLRQVKRYKNWLKRDSSLSATSKALSCS